MKTSANRVLKLVFLAFFLINMLVFPLNAASVNKVRVGYINSTDYFENINGKFSGYGYEYFQKIAKLNNYQYVYVEAKSYDELYDLFKHNHIDITPNRLNDSENVLFETQNYIFGSNVEIRANAFDNRFVENDITSYADASIGIVDSDEIEELLLETFKKYDLEARYSYYDNYSDLSQALNEEEIDLIISPSIFIDDSEKTLANIGTQDYSISGGNAKLVQECDETIARIKEIFPKFISDLNARYTKQKNLLQLLNDSEKEYVAFKEKVIIATTVNRRPMSYWEKGVFKGIVETITTKIVEDAGLKPEYIEVENLEEAIAKLRRNEVDMITGIYSDYSFSEPNNFILSEPYVEINHSIVQQKSNTRNKSLCLNDAYFQRNIAIMNYYGDVDVIYTDSDASCMQYVSLGKSDFTIVNTYLAKDVIVQYNYKNLETTFAPIFTHETAIAYNYNVNPHLISVIDKAIYSLSDDVIQEAIYLNDRNEYKFDLLNFFYTNPLYVISICLVIITMAMFIITYVMLIRQKYNSKVYKLVYHDMICDIKNMNYLTQEASKMIKNTHKQYAIASFNIERFKSINESYSREIGNIVLNIVANALKEMAVNQEMIARMTADYFVILTEFTTNEDLEKQIMAIKEKLHFTNVNGINIHINFHVGIYVIKDPSIDIMAGVDNAELARLQSKEMNKNQCVFFNALLEERLNQEKNLEAHMHMALANNEFKVYFQPKYDMRNNEMIGAEALIRWKSPTIGMMAPNIFIPYFEKNGFINELDFYVLEEVMRLIEQRRNNHLPILPFSVNQSRIHLTDPFYFERLLNLKNKYNIPDGIIELEITETTFMNVELAPIMAENVKKLGFKVSMDDFGSGYSSLNILKSLSIDVIKIDKEFLKETDTNPKAKIIIENVVQMAKDLELEVICEGVEDLKQVDFLLSVGCNFAQGYLYAKPMQLMEFEELLDQLEVEENE